LKRTMIKMLGITILVLLMFVGIAGAQFSPENLLSPDGSKMYQSRYYPWASEGYDVGEGFVDVIDTSTNMVLATIEIYRYDGPSGLAISSDGKTLYVCGSDGGAITVIDTTTNEIITRLDLGDLVCSPYYICFSPNEENAYVFTNNRLGIIDTTTYNLQILKHLDDIGMLEHPEDISFSGDGRYAYVTWEDGFVQTLEADTPSVPEFPSFTMPVVAILGLIIVFGRRKE